MSNLTLIIGESGSGKSSSIKNLNDNETFIINVLGKPLPFKNYSNRYKKINKDGDGNYIETDDYEKILRTINYINNSMPKIRNLIIDDFQYVMANEFMRRAKEKGYEKFTEIGLHSWQIIESCSKTRDNLYCFFLSHSEESENGKRKCKTIGKMIDDKITIEGMFTIVLHSIVSDNKYKFITQNNGVYIAKSPLEMFEESVIDNDLSFVRSKIENYYEGEVL